MKIYGFFIINIFCTNYKPSPQCAQMINVDEIAREIIPPQIECHYREGLLEQKPELVPDL